jgi:hypothetical protein
VDVEGCADELYAIPPEQFVARRTELAAQALAAGDRALAKSISALRRPTRAAWLANLVARESPDELGALLGVGADLREAQAHLDGPALRRLSSERSRAVGALARRAAALSAEHGHPASDGQIQELSQLLQAALADDDLAEAVRRGQVAQTVSYGGFGPWQAGGADVGPAAARSTGPRGGAEDKADEPARAGPSTEEIAAARADWESAENAVRAAEMELARAEQRAESASAELDRVRAELARLEAADEQARSAQASAVERLVGLREKADQRRRSWESLTAG